MGDYAELGEFPKNMLERQVYEFMTNGKIGPALKPYWEEWVATNPVQEQQAPQFYEFIKNYLTSMPEESEGQQAGPPIPWAKMPGGEVAPGRNAGERCRHGSKK